MDRDADAILERVTSLVERLAGKRLDKGPDARIAADFGVRGWDGIELLEELEAAYCIDLRPFADARGTTKKFLFWKVKVGGDATPRGLAQHIDALLSRL